MKKFWIICLCMVSFVIMPSSCQQQEAPLLEQKGYSQDQLSEQGPITKGGVCDEQECACSSDRSDWCEGCGQWGGDCTCHYCLTCAMKIWECQCFPPQCPSCLGWPCACPKICQICLTVPCECCKICKTYPCSKCCKICNYWPCKCCKICKTYPCSKCCNVCAYWPCICCPFCENYPCVCTPCDICDTKPPCHCIPKK